MAVLAGAVVFLAIMVCASRADGGSDHSTTFACATSSSAQEGFIFFVVARPWSYGTATASC